MSIEIDGNTVKAHGGAMTFRGDFAVSGTMTAGGVELSGGPQEVSSVLASPVALPASLTEYTVLQADLLPGRWLLMASVLAQAGESSGVGWTVKVWDGASTVYAGANQSSQNAEREQITPPTVVVQLTEPTTVFLSVSATIDGITDILTGGDWVGFAVRATSFNDETATGVTRLLALRLGY